MNSRIKRWQKNFLKKTATSLWVLLGLCIVSFASGIMMLIIESIGPTVPLPRGVKASTALIPIYGGLPIILLLDGTLEKLEKLKKACCAA